MFFVCCFYMLSIYLFLFLFCVVEAFSCFRFACFSLSVWCCWLFPRQDHPKFNTFPPRLSRINGISQFLSNFEFLHRMRIISDVFKSTLVGFPSKSSNSVFVSGRKASRGGTRLPSECDYLPKYSSFWRLSIDNRHKREHSAVDCAAKCRL